MSKVEHPHPRPMRAEYPTILLRIGCASLAQRYATLRVALHNREHSLLWMDHVECRRAAVTERDRESGTAGVCRAQHARHRARRKIRLRRGAWQLARRHIP